MESKLVRGEFIKQVLQEELGVKMLKAQSQAIAKRINFSSNSRLDGGRSVEVESNPSDLDGLAKFTHPGHERALDINMRKLHRGEIGKDGKQLKYWRSFRIHNNFIWGHYNRIAYRLMYGLTAEVAEGIKKELEGDL